MEEFKLLKSIISESYSTIEPLVVYLDKESLLHQHNFHVNQPKQNLGIDVKTFKKEFDNINAYINELQ